MNARTDRVELKSGSPAEIDGALVVVMAVDAPRVKLEIAEASGDVQLDWHAQGDVVMVAGSSWRIHDVGNPRPAGAESAQGADAGQAVARLTRENESQA